MSDNHTAETPWWGGKVPGDAQGRKPSAAATAKLKEIAARYPNPHSAVMPALYIAQEELGHLSKEALAWVAESLSMSPVQVMEVASFYTMYYKKPVGRYHVQVCRTLSCMVRGAPELTATLEKKLGCHAHEVTHDGMFSFEEVECLGSCGTAPMCQVNDRFFENLDGEKLAALIEEIKREQPNLSLSMKTDKLGDGLSTHGMSAVRPNQSNTNGDKR